MSTKECYTINSHLSLPADYKLSRIFYPHSFSEIPENLLLYVTNKILKDISQAILFTN